MRSQDSSHACPQSPPRTRMRSKSATRSRKRSESCVETQQARFTSISELDCNEYAVDEVGSPSLYLSDSDEYDRRQSVMNNSNTHFRAIILQVYTSSGGCDSCGRVDKVGCATSTGSPDSLTAEMKTCRWPYLVANRVTLPQKWPPPPRNVADLCELTATIEPRCRLFLVVEWLKRIRWGVQPRRARQTA